MSLSPLGTKAESVLLTVGLLALQGAIVQIPEGWFQRVRSSFDLEIGGLLGLVELAAVVTTSLQHPVCFMLVMLMGKTRCKQQYKSKYIQVWIFSYWCSYEYQWVKSPHFPVIIHSSNINARWVTGGRRLSLIFIKMASRSNLSFRKKGNLPPRHPLL